MYNLTWLSPVCLETLFHLKTGYAFSCPDTLSSNPVATAPFFLDIFHHVTKLISYFIPNPPGLYQFQKILLTIIYNYYLKINMIKEIY